MDKDVYRQQGFGRTLGFGASPALLIVDLANGFLDPEVFGGGNIAAAADRTRDLLAFARSRRLPFAFSRIVYADDGADAGIWCQKAPRLRELTEDANASQIVAALAPEPGELVVRKTQASAFFGTGLAAWLVQRRVDTLLVAGCTTSGCVRASVVDAISMNLRPVVVEDCVGDRAEGPHRSNLFDMRQKYADVLRLDQLIPQLG